MSGQKCVKLDPVYQMSNWIRQLNIVWENVLYFPNGFIHLEVSWFSISHLLHDSLVRAFETRFRQIIHVLVLYCQ